MIRPRRIVITGFMGAGKTTAARALARKLGCAFIDLDELVTEREGRGPHELIEAEGEAAFREAETRALRAALDDETARVIALGGGTWTLEGNRAQIAAQDCLTVWLDAPFELCWQRINSGAGDERPLARDRATAEKLFDERHALYALAARRVRVTPRQSAGEVADLIEGLLSAEDGSPVGQS